MFNKLTVIGIYVKMYLFILAVSFIGIAQEKSEVGDFDIAKVRAAVLTGADSLGIVEQSAPASQKSESQSYVLVTFRIIGYLLLLIVIIAGAAWFIKKIGLSGSSKLGGGGAMDLLEALPFGQNRTVVLIRVLDTVYLLGQTPTSIELLEKIEGQRAFDLISSSKGTSIVQFKDAFNNFLGKMKKS